MQQKVSDARLAVKVGKIYSVRKFNMDRHIGINMKTCLARVHQAAGASCLLSPNINMLKVKFGLNQTVKEYAEKQMYTYELCQTKTFPRK